MHVLIIPSWYPENSADVNGIFFREQALAIAKNTTQVGVISLSQSSLLKWPVFFKNPYEISEENDHGVPTFRWHGTRIPIIHQLNGLMLARQGVRLFQKYVDHYGKPDILHVHSILYGGVIAHAINKVTGIPYIITEHSTLYARNLIQSSKKTMAKEPVRSASYRLAVSEQFAELLENYFGAEAGKWHYLPNMISNQFTDSKSEYLKSPRVGFTFLTVALLTQKKKIDNLIQAFELSFKNMPHVTLRIGGDGPDRKQLEKLTAKILTENRVIFLGSLTREQVIYEMAKTDAFVLPSRYETFGLVLAEALAMGKPVIATRSGGPESIVRPQDGHLVPVDNIQALSTAMREIYQNITTYNPIEIRQACLKRFSESAVTTRLKQIYEEVLANQNK